jgi:hypothetical protein
MGYKNLPEVKTCLIVRHSNVCCFCFRGQTHSSRVHQSEDNDIFMGCSLAVGLSTSLTLIIREERLRCP